MTGDASLSCPMVFVFFSPKSLEEEAIHQWLEFLLGVDRNCHVISESPIVVCFCLAWLWLGLRCRACYLITSHWVDPFCWCVEGIFQQQSKEKLKERCLGWRHCGCRMAPSGFRWSALFVLVWRDSIMLCSLCWQPIFRSLQIRSNALVTLIKANEKGMCWSLYFFWSCEMEKTMSLPTALTFQPPC